jgi:hypothetical protein
MAAAAATRETASEREGGMRLCGLPAWVEPFALAALRRVIHHHLESWKHYHV